MDEPPTIIRAGKYRQANYRPAVYTASLGTPYPLYVEAAYVVIEPGISLQKHTSCKLRTNAIIIFTGRTSLKSRIQHD